MFPAWSVGLDQGPGSAAARPSTAGRPRGLSRSSGGWTQPGSRADVAGQVGAVQPHGLVPPGRVQLQLVGEVRAGRVAALAGGDDVLRPQVARRAKVDELG